VTDSARLPLHRIAIVGGGAGGLELAVRLGRRLGRSKRAEIILVDAARTHLWKPLLHQVAAGTLDSHADEIEYLALARKNHFHFRLGRMDRLDRNRREIGLAPTCDDQGEEILPRRAIPYDTLVLALGSQTNDFGTPGARKHANLLDSPAEANDFHTRLVNSFLRAQVRTEGSPRERFTITIIGGGATGVELSAELHMTASIVSSYGLVDFHPERDLRIVVIDAGPRLLPMLPERVSNAVLRELRALGIEVQINEKVVEVKKDGVQTASGSFIKSDIIVWAAGIKVADFVANLEGLESNSINQLAVKRNLQTTRDAAIFAIGDCAACPQEAGKYVPPRAQAAHQQAEMLARSLEGLLNGKPLLDFTYKDYGSLVSLGDYSTVGSLMGAVSRGSLFIEGHIAKWMYWWLRKHHQIAVNGLFHTWLATWVEFIDRVRNPRIKLH
jgi:NADH:ubiquinone reductase (H+-translocating)